MEDAVINTVDTIDELEELAAWHRLNAERAGSSWVWDARLRAAEDLERRAAELRTRHASERRVAPRAAGRSR